MMTEIAIFHYTIMKSGIGISNSTITITRSLTLEFYHELVIIIRNEDNPTTHLETDFLVAVHIV